MDDNKVWWDIDKIKPDPDQPRKIFSDAHILGLSESLKVEGMINSIEVDPNGMIITGECRWRAAHLLKWEKVPVNINANNFSEYTRLRRQLAENVHQSGTSQDSLMNPIDTAKAYKKLCVWIYEKETGKEFRAPDSSVYQLFFGLNIAEKLGQEMGVDASTVYEFLRLLEEPEFVQRDIELGRPRTYYRSADSAPKEIVNQIKKKIATGDYRDREEIRQEVAILKKLPELTETTLARQRSRESKGVNRILNITSRVALALEAMPLEQIDLTEKGLVKNQLIWLRQIIDKYLKEEKSLDLIYEMAD